MKKRFSRAFGCSVFVAILAFQSLYATAGVREGGGGDDAGLEFTTSAQVALSDVSNDPSLVPAQLLVQLQATFAHIKVIVVDNSIPVQVGGSIQNSAAYSDPTDDTVTLSRSRWSSISDERVRRALALHELLVLDQRETTGIYPISSQYLAQYGYSLPQNGQIESAKGTSPGCFQDICIGDLVIGHPSTAGTLGAMDMEQGVILDIFSAEGKALVTWQPFGRANGNGTDVTEEVGIYSLNPEITCVPNSGLCPGDSAEVPSAGRAIQIAHVFKGGWVTSVSGTISTTDAFQSSTLSAELQQDCLGNLCKGKVAMISGKLIEYNGPFPEDGSIVIEHFFANQTVSYLTNFVLSDNDADKSVIGQSVAQASGVTPGTPCLQSICEGQTVLVNGSVGTVMHVFVDGSLLISSVQTDSYGLTTKNLIVSKISEVSPEDVSQSSPLQKGINVVYSKDGSYIDCLRNPQYFGKGCPIYTVVESFVNGQTMIRFTPANNPTGPVLQLVSSNQLFPETNQLAGLSEDQLTYYAIGSAYARVEKLFSNGEALVAYRWADMGGFLCLTYDLQLLVPESDLSAVDPTNIPSDACMPN